MTSDESVKPQDNTLKLVVENSEEYEIEVLRIVDNHVVLRVISLKEEWE